MAKQGKTRWERTMFGLTFYRLHNDWYIRRKSRLTCRRVKTSKRFAKTREFAGRLGVASKMASPVYQSLPKEWRIFEQYKKLTGIAYTMLNDGRSEKEIHLAFQQQLRDWGYREDIQYEAIQPSAAKVRVSHFRKIRRKSVKNITAPAVEVTAYKERRRVGSKTMRSIFAPHYSFFPEKKKLVYVRQELLDIPVTTHLQTPQLIKPPGYT